MEPTRIAVILSERRVRSSSKKDTMNDNKTAITDPVCATNTPQPINSPRLIGR